MFEELDHPQQRAFLAAYAQLGTVTKAALAVGISRETHYDWKRRDTAYRKAYKHAAEQTASRTLRMAALRSAERGQ